MSTGQYVLLSDVRALIFLGFHLYSVQLCIA